MNHLPLLLSALLLCPAAFAASPGKTSVSIVGEDFHLNGLPTYAGRVWNGHRIEGRLLNSHLGQATFDDWNPETAQRWAYATRAGGAQKVEQALEGGSLARAVTSEEAVARSSHSRF